jgi:hypothetical protein
VGPHCAEGVEDDNIFSCLVASKVAAAECGHAFSWNKEPRSEPRSVITLPKYSPINFRRLSKCLLATTNWSSLLYNGANRKRSRHVERRLVDKHTSTCTWHRHIATIPSTQFFRQSLGFAVRRLQSLHRQIDNPFWFTVLHIWTHTHTHIVRLHTYTYVRYKRTYLHTDIQVHTCTIHTHTHTCR